MAQSDIFKSDMFKTISGNIGWHIDVEAGFQSWKSTIAETGLGVTSRP